MTSANIDSPAAPFLKARAVVSSVADPRVKQLEEELVILKISHSEALSKKNEESRNMAVAMVRDAVARTVRENSAGRELTSTRYEEKVKALEAKVAVATATRATTEKRWGEEKKVLETTIVGLQEEVKRLGYKTIKFQNETDVLKEEIASLRYEGDDEVWFDCI